MRLGHQQSQQHHTVPTGELSECECWEAFVGDAIPKEV